MSVRIRFRSAVALTAAVALSGCLTPHAKPVASQAILDARAHRDVPAPDACPQTPLAQVTPLMVAFSFGGADPGAAPAALDPQLPWIACHPAVALVIRPDADNHGTAAEQDALALQRARAVQAYLTAHGVAAARIRVLPRAGAEPAGEHVLIRAEGRRW